MKNLKILLVGQPNVGKSSLLNALVGTKVVVSNYPGTTVEVIQSEKIFDNTKIVFEDTPGIYSISDRSEEEKVTERALFEEEADEAIVVIDATSLERGLYVVLQILEAGIPVVIALNFVEEAEKKGIKINCEKLEKLLNLPVVPINPLTKKGINNLADAILKIEKTARKGFKGFKIKYDDHIEKAIRKISAQANQVNRRLPKRFISIRCLEGDEDFYKYIENKKVIREVKEDLEEHHPQVAKDITITRYGIASFIAEKATRITPLRKEKIGEKIDKFLLNKTWGPLGTGLFLLIIFGILLYLGNLIQGVLMDLTNDILSSFVISEHSIVFVILSQGLTGLAAGIAIALPYVFLFYLLLGLLEDIGLLSRFVVNAERFLKKIGLPGKAFIPLVLGFGCTVPAIRATKVVSSKKEQFQTASLLPFVPCSSRTAIIFGIVGFYGGTKLAFSVFITLFIAGLIWAFGVKKFFHIKSKPLLLELPPYRKPLPKKVLAKSWIRMKDFIYIVIPLLLIGGMVYGFLKILSLTNAIVEPFSSIAVWLGLPAATLIPLVFGFLQKDLTGAMLISVLGSEISLALTPIQIYTFGVAATIGIPCINALGMLIKEFGFKKAALLTTTSTIYGLIFAGLLWRIISFS